MKNLIHPLLSCFLLTLSLCALMELSGSNKTLNSIKLISNPLSVTPSLHGSGFGQPEVEEQRRGNESDTDSYEEELRLAIEMSYEGYQEDCLKERNLEKFQVSHEQEQRPVQLKKSAVPFIPEAVNKKFGSIICLFLPEYYPAAQKLFCFLYVDLLNIIHGHLGLAKFFKKDLPGLCDLFVLSTPYLLFKDEDNIHPMMKGSYHGIKERFEEARLNGTEEQFAEILTSSLRNGKKITMNYAYSGLWMNKKGKELPEKDKHTNAPEQAQFPWVAKLKLNRNFVRDPSFYAEVYDLLNLTLDETLKPNRVDYLPSSKVKKNLSELLVEIEKNEEEREEKRNKEFDLYWEQERLKKKDPSSSDEEWRTKQKFFLERGYTWDQPALIYPIFAFCIPKTRIYNKCVPSYGKTSKFNIFTERRAKIKSKNREVMAKFLPSAKSIIKRGGRYFLLTMKGWEELEASLQDQLRDFENPRENKKKQNLIILTITDQGASYEYLVVQADFLAVIDFGKNNNGIHYGLMKLGRFSFTKKDDKLLQDYLKVANEDYEKSQKSPFREEDKSLPRGYESEDIYAENSDSSEESE